MNIEDFKLNLQFSIEEMNLIFKFLETIPYGQVSGLYENIKQQVDTQLVSPSEFDNNKLTINTDYPV